MDVPTGKALHNHMEFTHPVKSVAFSPDGKTLATAGTDKIWLWQLADR
jgi:WD40 repeat protein